MSYDEKLVDEGSVRILLADEYESDGPFTEDQFKCARLALGIGEELVHDGDCTDQAYTCQLCARGDYQRRMRAALAAIDASSTHWVAPQKAPPLPTLRRMVVEWMYGSEPTQVLWDKLREACLAERHEGSER